MRKKEFEEFIEKLRETIISMDVNGWVLKYPLLRTIDRMVSKIHKRTEKCQNKLGEVK